MTRRAVVAIAPATHDRVAATRPRVVSTATLNAIWTRANTRSREREFAGLRRETLAFHRCSMQITAQDRAVARCDGTWTIDFPPTGNRWTIRRVSNSR